MGVCMHVYALVRMWHTVIRGLSFVWWLLKELVKKINKTRHLLLAGTPVVTHATTFATDSGLLCWLRRAGIRDMTNMRR